MSTSKIGLQELEDSQVAPNLLDIEGVLAPSAPAKLEDFDVDPSVLTNLALKTAHTVPIFTTSWAVEKLCLPRTVVAELLDGLRADQLLEVLGQEGPFNYRFAITKSGREQAARLLEVSGYVGPAPVSLEKYSQMLKWQFDHLPDVEEERIKEALSVYVLPDHAVQVAGLAMMARRSLFLHGPPGNGKTSVGYMIHDAVEGDLWIPWCIGVEDNIIRVYDPQVHEPPRSEVPDYAAGAIDRRWVRVRRPFIVVGGELTMEALDLMYSQSVGFYEAPLHFKANGGTFLLDDFGCQRMSPDQMLNRWIVPLERHVDFLSLQTGQQLEVPFQQMLVISTNIDPEKVMSPAFLRRMGYRLYLGNPDPEAYARIFRRYAADRDLDVPAGLIEGLQQRYVAEERPMRGCESRDLIERVRDICKYTNRPMELTEELLNEAWIGYFGNAPPSEDE